MPQLITAMANYVTCRTNRQFMVRYSTTEKTSFLTSSVFYLKMYLESSYCMLYFWLNVVATVWLSSLLPHRQLLLYTESPCGPPSSMAARDEWGRGGGMQASLFFLAKSSVSACSYAVWRSIVLFSSNHRRITGDVIPQIKASLTASSPTCLAVLSLKLQSYRNLSRLNKKFQSIRLVFASL